MSERLVRPYLVTGGRTTARGDLPIEALVRTTAGGREAAFTTQHERRDVVLLCRTAISVAEVAARTSLPLGVVRVLLDDLIADDLIEVLGSPRTDDGPDVPLLERLLDGLRAL